MGVTDQVDLAHSLPRAVEALKEMADPRYVTADKAIPLKLLQNAKGFAFTYIIKVGVAFIGGQIGGGIVIAKVPDASAPGGFRWSAPVGITCGGLQGGFIWGGQRINSIVILNTDSAIKGMMGEGQVRFGGSIGLAAGPVGREAEANVAVSDTKQLIPAYSYSSAAGLYIGATLDGVVIKANLEDIKSFYSDPTVTPTKILSGQVQAPPSCNEFYQALSVCLSATTTSSTAPAPSTPLHQSGKAQEGLGPLPPGWTEYRTPEGQPYYSDGKTTVWERPQPPAPSPPPPPPPPALPAGWEVLYTADGKPYYLHRGQNKTQWEVPR
jgi:lipid-binding SYLF domain-containing protein